MYFSLCCENNEDLSFRLIISRICSVKDLSERGESFSILNLGCTNFTFMSGVISSVISGGCMVSFMTIVSDGVTKDLNVLLLVLFLKSLVKVSIKPSEEFSRDQPRFLILTT